MKSFLIMLTLLSTAVYLNPYDAPVSPYDKPPSPYDQRYCDFDGVKKPC
jgi:hypothetical protein